MPADADLLAIEIETIWEADGRGRLSGTREAQPAPPPLMVLAVARDGQRIALSRDVSDAIETQLSQITSGLSAGHEVQPSSQPAEFRTCAALLRDACGPIIVASGPSYTFPATVDVRSELTVVRSDGDPPTTQALPVLGSAGWTPIEWRQLLDGESGAWAAAVKDGEVVALCHSARLSEAAAEAGVWTGPLHRGQGYAAAVTAAWASLHQRTGRLLFYSTSRENRSSQRVASRLNLREIGWLWKLEVAPASS